MPEWTIIAKNTKRLEQAIHCLNKLGYKFRVNGLKIHIQVNTIEDMFKAAAKVEECLKELEGRSNA